MGQKRVAIGLCPCHHTTHACFSAWLRLGWGSSEGEETRLSPHGKVCADHYWAWESRPREISPMPRRLRIVVIGLMALIVFCVAPVTAADKIKIGYIATMSGPAASLGQHILDVFKLGMAHVGNTLGGLPVDLIVGDDQLKPDVGVQVASKMVEKDKVDFITGVVFSNVMMAI